MHLEDIYKNYAFNDGTILSFQLDIQLKKFIVKLKVRRLLPRQKFEYCLVELEFNEVKEVYIFEDFPTQGDYSDITLTKLDTGEYYLSLDPYGNLGIQNDKDNYIVKANRMTFINGSGVSEEIL